MAQLGRMVPSNAPEVEGPSGDELARGLKVARHRRVAVFVVAYNAESHIRETLRRIPEPLLELLASIYVIDDSSSDETTRLARSLQEEIGVLEVFTTPYNQGYGGNQKLGYEYASRRGFDVVVLLHGDGQYAPEYLPRILAPFDDRETAAVFGSRMMVPGAARRGGMPLYKYLGNRVLTMAENRLLDADLSEFHSGYRAYRVSALEQVPYQYNTDDFHFDTEIIIQLLARGMKIVEVPIPTYYGDEICHVEGIPYAAHCIGTVLRSRANRYHLVYHPKFDVFGNDEYVFKEAPNTVHQHVLDRAWTADQRVLEVGAGHGEVGRRLHVRGLRVVALDLESPETEVPFPYLEADLAEPFADEATAALGGPADAVLALDVLEHLPRPEESLQEIRRVMKPGGRLVASTGNVAFILVRLMLLLGQFNYGKKGILDLTHTRLFTVRSFCRTLEGAGFRVDAVRGFGPPIVDMVGRSWVLRLLNGAAGWLARVWPRLFAYQILVEATRLDDVDTLLDRTLESGEEEVETAAAPAD
ncbi:MAG: bifunctional glycosyltransferase/class I SAM-dependent methyltransferase [Longimicrobiales bacterium]|nr:bifunctional glycosyltransferase/class I SAM-dependent methyltransferase [Longimicrobiales bacterium]